MSQDEHLLVLGAALLEETQRCVGVIGCGDCSAAQPGKNKNYAGLGRRSGPHVQARGPDHRSQPQVLGTGPATSRQWRWLSAGPVRRS